MAPYVTPLQAELMPFQTKRTVLTDVLKCTACKIITLLSVSLLSCHGEDLHSMRDRCGEILLTWVMPHSVNKKNEKLVYKVLDLGLPYRVRRTMFPWGLCKTNVRAELLKGVAYTGFVNTPYGNKLFGIKMLRPLKKKLTLISQSQAVLNIDHKNVFVDHKTRR